MGLQVEFIKNVVKRSGYDYDKGRLHPENIYLDQNNPQITINASNEIWFLIKNLFLLDIQIQSANNLYDSNSINNEQDREYIMQAFTEQINININANINANIQFVVFTPEGKEN